MEQLDGIVYLLDDDAETKETLSEHLASRGRVVRSFSSAEEFLAYVRPNECSCLILEMDLPDANGLELQRQLSTEVGPQIIFLSKQSSVTATVCAMKAGAIEFLMKPVDVTALMEAVELALARDRRRRQKHAYKVKLQGRLRSLTPRQREVFSLVVAGLLNKEAAAVLDISEVTLQIHRSQIMRKMAAGSLAELVRMAIALHLPYWQGFQFEDRGNAFAIEQCRQLKRI